jgi:hypothetical protein
VRAARALPPSAVTPPSLDGLEKLDLPDKEIPEDMDGVEMLHTPPLVTPPNLDGLEKLDLPDKEIPEDMDGVEMLHTPPLETSNEIALSASFDGVVDLDDTSTAEPLPLTTVTDHGVMEDHPSPNGTPRHQRKTITSNNMTLSTEPPPSDCNLVIPPTSNPSPIPVKIPERPRPRPAYLGALEERAALTQRAAAAPSPVDLPTANAKPAHVFALEKRAAAEATVAVHPPTHTPPHPRRARQPTPAPEVPEGPRIRRLTALGLQREKALEEQREKSAKATLRKADREKASNEAKGNNKAGANKVKKRRK